MIGFVLEMALLVSSSGASATGGDRACQSHPRFFNFALPDDASTSRLPRQLADERFRVWQRTSLPRRQTTPAKRFSTTDRVIAVAAGVAVGWVVDGAIGYKLTQRSNSADDVSGLRGVIIGAPIGAAAGAILGWKLTDK